MKGRLREERGKGGYVSGSFSGCRTGTEVKQSGSHAEPWSVVNSAVAHLLHQFLCDILNTNLELTGMTRDRKMPLQKRTVASKFQLFFLVSNM